MGGSALPVHTGHPGLGAVALLACGEHLGSQVLSSAAVHPVLTPVLWVTPGRAPTGTGGRKATWCLRQCSVGTVKGAAVAQSLLPWNKWGNMCSFPRAGRNLCFHR